MKKIMCGLMLLLSMTCFGQTYVKDFWNISSALLVKRVNIFIQNKNIKDIQFKYFDGMYYAFIIWEG